MILKHVQNNNIFNPGVHGGTAGSVIHTPPEVVGKLTTILLLGVQVCEWSSEVDWIFIQGVFPLFHPVFPR